VAKALVDAARETRVLEVRGGMLEGRPIEAAEIESLAKLPPLDVLRSQVLATVIAPLTGIVALFTAPLQDLYGLIEARIEQLEAQGDTSATQAGGSDPQSAQAAEEPAAQPESEAGEETSGSEPQADKTETETETATNQKDPKKPKQNKTKGQGKKTHICITPTQSHNGTSPSEPSQRISLVLLAAFRVSLF